MADTSNLDYCIASQFFGRFDGNCINHEMHENTRHQTKSKNVILRVWIFGFIADFIGTAAMFLANIIDFDYETQMGKWWYKNITNAVSFNPFDSIYAFLWVTVCVILTAFLIFIFNYKFCLKKSDLSDNQRKKLALSLAIFTAPYLFYFPTALFY